MQITGMQWGHKLLDLVEFPRSDVRGAEISVDEIKEMIAKHKMVFIKPVFKGGVGKKGKSGLIGRVDNVHDALKEKERLYFAEHRDGNAVFKSDGVTFEGGVPAEHEIYFSISDNTEFRTPAMTITHHGGVDIEELPAEKIDTMFPHKRMHGGNHRLVQYYRASPDHKRVLFGARGTDARDRALQNGKALKIHLLKIFPELESAKLEYSWSGKVAYTFDHAPHLGRHDSLYFAMGYCGSGVTRTIYLAHKLAKRILGEDGHETAFDDIPFESKPFYSGSPWFMPPLLKWHSFLDRIEGN